MTMPVAGVWSVDQTESAAVLVGCQRSRFFKYMDKITLGMTLIPIATICGMFFCCEKNIKLTRQNMRALWRNSITGEGR